MLFGVWRSLVAHLHGVQGVEGSNPFTPTKKESTGVSGCQSANPFLLRAGASAWPRGNRNGMIVEVALAGHASKGGFLNQKVDR